MDILPTSQFRLNEYLPYFLRILLFLFFSANIGSIKYSLSSSLFDGNFQSAPLSVMVGQGLISVLIHLNTVAQYGSLPELLGDFFVVGANCAVAVEELSHIMELHLPHFKQKAVIPILVAPDDGQPFLQIAESMQDLSRSHNHSTSFCQKDLSALLPAVLVHGLSVAK